MPPKSPKTKSAKSPKKKSSGKKPTAKRPAGKSGGYSLKALIAGLLLLGFLVLSLVLLSQVSRHFRPEAPPSPPSGGRTVSQEDLRVEVDSFLLRSGIPLSTVRPLPGGADDGLEVQASFPSADRLEGLERRLARLDPGLRVDPDRQGGSVVFRRGQKRLFRLLFRPPKAPSVPPAEPAPEPPVEAVPEPPAPQQVPLSPGAARPRLAIIMDDLGRDMATGRRLVEIDLPVTFAILPDQTNSARLAEFAHRHGREIIIHIPMEPQGYPVTDPGRDALFVQLSAEEVQARMRDFIARVPHAVGGNNHMGSRFTEDRAGMRATLEIMQEAGLFFVDSLTSASSVGFEEARAAGIPAAVRNVFLDNVQEERAVISQIRKLAHLALQKGQAVGICHPHPQTLAALRQTAPELARMGIEVVPVSALLER